MKSPFKFLDAYTRKDRDVFFGRETEIEILYDLVSQNRLVLVYGQSGAGKTSLIQCGLSNRFKPTNWFPIFIRRGNNLNDSIRHELEEALGYKSEASLPEIIEELYEEYLRPIYLILDQLEEVFILGDEEERELFIRDIADINKSKLPCQIIFSLREEYLANLYSFEQTIPSLFDRRLRVEPMSVQNATKVIISSCKKFNVELSEPQNNARQIIEKISAGRSGVSLPYLQVYLDRLYKDDLYRTYADKIPDKIYPPLTFTTEEIEDLGELGDVLNIFLDEQLNTIQEAFKLESPHGPKEAVKKIVNEFASLEGTKIPRRKEEIELPGLSPEDINFILSSLLQSRILREEEGIYELAHDTLSQRISEQRSASEVALLEIVDLIKNREAASKKSKAFLNGEELQLIDNYKDQLRDEKKLSPELLEFVDKSRQEIKNQRKQRTRIVSSIIAILLFLLAVSAYQWRLADARLENLVISQKEILHKELQKQEELLFNLQYGKSYQMLLELSDWEVYDPQIRTHLLELAYYYNAISNISRADSLLERVFEIEKVPQKKFNEQFAQKKIIADLAGEKLFNLLEERYYPTMIEIEGSRFKMGGQKENTKKIFPEVMLKDFKIGKYEITEFQYELFLKNNGKTLEDHPKPSWQWYGQSPITNVDWFDAVEYSNWLSLEKGLSPAYTLDKDKPDPNYLRDDVEKNWLVILDTSAYAYRLPTEREWEFAAGGGKDGHDESGHSIYKYSGSDSMEEVAWYWLNGTEATGYHQALPVGLKKPNQLGIHDMSGNAMEWVNDWYEKDYYHKARVNYSTYGPSSGAHRILRGGGWGSKDRSLMQVNTRDYTLPYHWQYVTHVGFRVALQIP